MIFCYVSGTFGGYNQVLQPAIPSEKKTHYIYLYKIRNRKKTSPLPLFKTGNPRTEEPPPIKSENPTKKPYKEPLLPCFSILFLPVIFAGFCMFFHVFQCYFACVTSLFYIVLTCCFCRILHVFSCFCMCYFAGVTLLFYIVLICYL